MLNYDLLVLGGGPGGYVAAIRAAQLGARVALVEKDQIGGTCLNHGCIPTKALIRSVDVLETTNKALEYGIITEKTAFDYTIIHSRKQNVVKMLREGVEGLLQANGVEVHYGCGRLLGTNLVEVVSSEQDTKNLEFDKLIIATGSKAYMPPLPGTDLPGVLTSSELLALTDLPESICIIGGGVIAMEFAYIMNALGVNVTVLEMLPDFLPFADKEIVNYLVQSFAERGVNLVNSAHVTGIYKTGESLEVHFRLEDIEEKVQAGLVLVATGRIPNLTGLEGLELKLDPKKGIAVNPYLKTSLPNVYAIGDVTGGIQLAHVATAQGLVAAENSLGGSKVFNDQSIPSCVYSKPEVAWVGLTEEEAARKYQKIKVGKFPFIGCGKAIVYGESDGLVKIIVDEKYGEILGIHIIGPEATNMIASGVIAKSMEATVYELAAQIHPHPTLSEVLVEAAHMALGHGVHYI